MSKEDPVTEESCENCVGILHTRINERPTLKIVLVALAVLASLIGYVYAGQGKIEQRQWEFAEKMVTQEDFREFKQENNKKLDKLQITVEGLRQ